jgi:hypothetical protein
LPYYRGHPDYWVWELDFDVSESRREAYDKESYKYDFHDVSQEKEEESIYYYLEG